MPPAPRWNLSELAPPPDWSLLDPWQESISAADFKYLLENVLTDGTAFWSTVEQQPDRALIRTSTAMEGGEKYVLRFAAESQARPSARYWRKATEMGPKPDEGLPLEGVRIALDPGHIGGDWAKMEARWYQMGTALPVMEGELTLRTARLLRPMLAALGAEVSLVRPTHDPLTAQQPDALIEEARKSLVISKGPEAELTDKQIRREAERLFYRTSEIRTRGQRVNEVLKPDLVVCLHFNLTSSGEALKSP